MKRKISYNRIAKIGVYVVFDILAVTVSWVLSLALSGCDFKAALGQSYYFYIGAVALALTVNALFGLYTKLLRYIDVNDVIKVIFAGVIEAAYFGAVAAFVTELTLEWFIIAALAYLMILGVSRVAYRVLVYIESASKRNDDRKHGVRVMVVGAGDAGSLIIKDVKNSDKLSMYPVCAIDDDPNKLGLMINGVKIVGGTKDIVNCAKKYKIEQIVVAMPSVDKKTLKRVLSECQKTDCKVKFLPGVYQLVKGNVTVSDMKDVEITDLLGRDSVKVNLNEIMGYIEEKTVLVTGGGGSIGSELCRQIAEHKPKRLVIVDIYENNAYSIQQELIRKYPALDLTVLIASVRDAKRIDEIFKNIRPEIVFHAAAHKHVPLMELSPNEAVKNNVGGTYNVADAAGRFGAKRFILISTDKAVNPTNIMGATKRVCEMIIQTMDKKYDTEYVAVRFGNVLGSNGSVVPLFKKQIAEGGPVTVTDKRIVRYFMTISEAVSLVLQAGAYAKGGEIFVLDMGEPVKIYDLAINMIKLSGLEPFTDIDVVEIGLRPGEKLYEERLMAEEGLSKTANDMISVGKPISFNERTLFGDIDALVREVYTETDEIKEAVGKIVPTYKPEHEENPLKRNACTI